MNEKNLDYLKKTLDYLGFGTKLNEVLETAIRRELPHFSLGINNIHKPLEIKNSDAPKTDQIQFELNFNKAKDSDMYFLNDYMVILHKTGELARVQTFDLERDHRITALQAYKLLSGLSFEKEIFAKSREKTEAIEKPEKIPVWFKLSLDITDAYNNHPLRIFRPEYGYQLEDSLAKYPLKGMENEVKTDALKALHNGNFFHTELQVGKKLIPVIIAANPQMKTIDIYDKNMREIRDEEIFPEKKTSQTEKAETSVNVENGKGIKNQKPAQATSEQAEQPWKQDQEVERTQSIGR